ncbi:cytosine/adenosine deaminase [Halteromyces radiatus]|uniref:cytosine/adenosine deaminase n=1 Tax=Halteromyces radiatus TaxID=101107 RepID=UPI0022200145|nr:cytosine/adenosine deaminase [Halteromyces radiatus]KAI8099771.1 cytosine/adenosine deaminase [Halteromyces radiatus]
MTLNHDDHIQHLRHTVKVAKRAMSMGRHPFGAILVGPDNQVIAEQGNIDTLNHAESTLCRTAYSNYPIDYLQKCTLYTSFEPCAMCSGSCYWAGIGTIVYGMSEKRLLELTGNNDKNPTMSLPCRDVFSAGQRQVQVIGPFPELEQEIVKDHLNFW